MFRHLLHENAVGIHLDVPNREAALVELLALLPSNRISPRRKGELLESLLQRERFGTTAIGDGAAFPHCTSSEITAPLAALGISRKGIDYPSLDGDPVHVIFLTVFPEAMDSGEKIKILQDIEGLIRDRFLMQRLKVSETPEEAYEFLQRESAQLVDFLPLAGRA